MVISMFSLSCFSSLLSFLPCLVGENDSIERPNYMLFKSINAIDDAISSKRKIPIFRGGREKMANRVFV